MRKQPTKVLWFLRIQELLNLQSLARAVGLGPLYGAVLAAFVALPDAQTQQPDYHYAGTDIYIKDKEMTINPFEPYFLLEAELHVINHPTNSVEEKVVKEPLCCSSRGQ